MNIMFDEQQAMLMALNISGNHVMCFNLKENRVLILAPRPAVSLSWSKYAPLMVSDEGSKAM